MSLPRIAPYALPAAHELPPARVGWTLDADRAVLLVHDMQRYFVRPFTPGAEPLAGAIDRIGGLLALARSLGMPVLYTAQPGDQDPAERALLTDFWGPGLSDAAADEAVIDELAPAPGEPVLTKWRYSAFQRTDLRARLDALGRDQLLITGIYTHIGCLTTAVDAFMQDVRAFLVADATADFSRDEHLAALRWAAGRCARVLTAAAASEQLRAGGPASGRRPRESSAR